MDELYYFSTCIITPDNTIKGVLHLDKEVYIDFNKEAIFIGEKKQSFAKQIYYDVLCKTLLSHPVRVKYKKYCTRQGVKIEQPDVNKAASFLNKKTANLSEDELMVNSR